MKQELTEMHGEPSRIGILIPSPNITLEKELVEYAPKEVLIHWNRVKKGSLTVTKESLIEMGHNVVEAAQSLAMTDVSMLAYACTSGSFVLGKDWDEQLKEQITRATSLPAITTSTAMLEGLLRVSASKLGLVTPYIEDVTSKAVQFLEENGFSVIKSNSLGIHDSKLIPRVSLEQIKKLAIETYRSASEMDSLFISCTNLPALDVLDELEDKLGIPVLSSNQVTLWLCLRKIGWKKPLTRGGSLLTSESLWT